MNDTLEVLAKLKSEFEGVDSLMVVRESQYKEIHATIAELRREVEAEKLFRRRALAPFLEWAQSYLYSGRWAGHDMFDAIKTELLERDAELAQAQADARELARALRGIDESGRSEREYHIQWGHQVLIKVGARYLPDVEQGEGAGT
jgi:hypothetical protein